MMNLRFCLQCFYLWRKKDFYKVKVCFVDNLEMVYEVLYNYDMYNKMNGCFKLFDIDVYKYILLICRDFYVKFFKRKYEKFVDMFVSDIMKFLLIKLKKIDNDFDKIFLKIKEVMEILNELFF